MPLSFSFSPVENVIVFALVIIKEGEQDEQNRRDRDIAVRDVENREIDQLKIKEIHHVAAENPVDQVAEGSAEQEEQAEAERQVPARCRGPPQDQ